MKIGKIYCKFEVRKRLSVEEEKTDFMVSMKDIARICDVSVASVSKALNGQPDIGAETRERICKTAAELGYMTNSAARTLKTNRSYNLGVLFSDVSGRGLTHEFFASVLDSFRVEAEQSGYDITFIRKRMNGRNTSYLQHCLRCGVDGVLIACEDFFDPQVFEVVNSSLPVVTLDHVFNNRPSILSDNVTGTESLVRYAVEKGHRRIAYVKGDSTAVTENRSIGFYRACEALNLEIPPEYVVEGAYYDSDRCYENVKKLLALPKRPTCILCPDDFSLCGGLRAVVDAGLKVPDDISLIGYDGIIVSQVMTPHVTTYRQNTKELGSAAAKKLIELIEHPKTSLPDRVIVSGELLPGESVKDISGSVS